MIEIRIQAKSDAYDRILSKGDVRLNIPVSNSKTTKRIAPNVAMDKAFETKLLLS